MVAECRASFSGHTVDIEIEGASAEIDAAVERLYQQYPRPAYGTWFNWPPGQLFTCGKDAGKPNTNLAPKDLGDGRWIARGHRSTSSD